MALIPRSFTIDEELYEKFRTECDDRRILISKWLRKNMVKQLDKWDNEK